MKKIILFLFVFALHFTPYTLHCLYSQQIGVGVEFSPSPPVKKKEEKKIKKKVENFFIFELAERFSLEEKKLNKLYNRGYGYLELIKIILIAKKADKPLEEIVKKRDKGKKMRKIAEEYQLDYQKIHLEALKIKDEIRSFSEVSRPLTSPTPKQPEISETE